jgi:hypothetical protein
VVVLVGAAFWFAGQRSAANWCSGMATVAALRRAGVRDGEDPPGSDATTWSQATVTNVSREGRLLLRGALVGVDLSAVLGGAGRGADRLR